VSEGTAASLGGEQHFRLQRRAALLRQPHVTGIERVTVEPIDARSWRLHLDLLAPAGGNLAAGVGREQISVGSSDPEAYRLRVEEVRAVADARLVVRVTLPPGEAPRPPAERAVYEVELVGVEALDPFFAAATFRLRQGAAGAAVLPPDDSGPDLGPDVSISYLAKDYASFRELMLGQMARELPEWRERNPTDLGVAIVEILAWTADQLSYYQDGVATEAYLGTARRRTSVARHVRLLDDVLREGNDARVWVEILLAPGAEGEVPLPRSTPLLAVGGAPHAVAWGSLAHRDGIAAGAVVFETMSEAAARPEHARLPIHTWGIDDYALREGAVSCALAGTVDGLAAGDPLAFVEVRDPRTGRAADADPSHRHVVRLSAPPRHRRDPLDGAAITDVEWFPEDALPFTLWVSRRGTGETRDGLAEARGNLVLADHGRTEFRLLPPVAPNAVYRPHLDDVGLTRREPWNERQARRAPARQATVQDPARALPAIVLYEVVESLVAAAAAGAADGAEPAPAPRLAATPTSGHGSFDEIADAVLALAARGDAAERELTMIEPWVRRWTPRLDLVGSGPFSRHFVVEGDLDHGLELRFGDGRQGARPAPGSRFVAVYRTGNGTAGNVGARSVTQVVCADERVAGATNPLAAAGGSDPEQLETARLRAPQAFHEQRRAVTRSDYEELARRHERVLDARATLSWTGSWTSALLRVQPAGGGTVDVRLRGELERSFRDLLLIGHQLEVTAPDWVPLEIVLELWAAAGALPVVVERHVAAALGSRQLPGGGSGYFHPDRFGFGEAVYVSQVVARAMEVEGVERVSALVFRRAGAGEPAVPLDGRLPMRPHEIARCDQDPDDPRWGTLTLVMRGRR
jgi:hypothetical protein